MHIIHGPQYSLTQDEACYWTLTPAAIGEIISGLESLSRLSDYGDKGLLRGRSALRERSFVPHRVRKALDTAAGAATLRVLAVTGGLLVLTGRTRRRQQIIGSALLLVTNNLIEYRSAFGRDGADQMAGTISGYRVLTATIPDANASDELFLRAVNAQTALSYLASGLAKLVSSTWRSGEALELILRTQQYGDSRTAHWIKQHPSLSKLLTWFTITWETAYPIVYLLPSDKARAFLTGVKTIHLGIAVVMGLPRFFWGFSSAHGAALYVIDASRKTNEG